MANQSLGIRILSAFLALVITLSACPIQAFAAETNTDAREDLGVRLPFTEVEDVDADVLHDATKVKQLEEEDPYAPTDVVRVSIVLNKRQLWKFMPPQMWLPMPQLWHTVTSSRPSSPL